MWQSPITPVNGGILSFLQAPLPRYTVLHPRKQKEVTLLLNYHLWFLWYGWLITKYNINRTYIALTHRHAGGIFYASQDFSNNLITISVIWGEKGRRRPSSSKPMHMNSKLWNIFKIGSFNTWQHGYKTHRVCDSVPHTDCMQQNCRSANFPLYTQATPSPTVSCCAGGWAWDLHHWGKTEARKSENVSIGNDFTQILISRFSQVVIRVFSFEINLLMPAIGHEH